MATFCRLAVAEGNPLFKTPEGMAKGRPTFSDADTGRRLDLILDPAADAYAASHGAVDVMVRGVYLVGANGTRFTVSDRPHQNGATSPSQPSAPRPTEDILYAHVREYAVRR